MPLKCGKSINKEEIKDIQKDMMSKMTLGKSMLSSLQSDSLLQKVSAKKMFKIPQKVIEVQTEGGGTTCQVPDDLIVVKEVKASKKGASIFFLVTDFSLETAEDGISKQVVTKEEFGVIKCTSLRPDGSKTVDLQKDIDKLKGVTDINSFIAKAGEIQTLYGSGTPQPDSVVVEKRAKNTSSVSLDDAPLAVVKVMVKKQGTNFFGGTRSFKQQGTLILLHEPGEPEKEKVYAEIIVKYKVPGTSSIAKGAEGNFDINQILAKVTKDKNFTTNDLKSINGAKVKGMMGSYQNELNAALQKADTSGPAGGIIKDIQKASGPGGFNLGSIDVGATIGKGFDLANNAAQGTEVQGAVNSLTSGDLTGAFNKAMDLNKKGIAAPGLPNNFDLTKNTDPTSAITGMFNITSISPSVPNLSEMDRAGSRVSDKVQGPLIKSISLTKTPVEIQRVEARKPDTNFFFNVQNFTRSGSKIILKEKYQEIKVTYTYKGPEIAPGEAFGSKTLDTCTDIPKIKLNIPKMTNQQIAEGKTIQDVIKKTNFAAPRIVPEAKPIPFTVPEKTYTETKLQPFALASVSIEIVKRDTRFIKKLQLLNFAYWNPKLATTEKEYKAIKKEPAYKSLLKKQKETGLFGGQMIEKGLLTDEEVNVFEKFKPLAIFRKTGELNKFFVDDIMMAEAGKASFVAAEQIIRSVGENDIADLYLQEIKKADDIITKTKAEKIFVKYMTKEDLEHLEKMEINSRYTLQPEGIATQEDKNVGILATIADNRKLGYNQAIEDKLKPLIPENI